VQEVSVELWWVSWSESLLDNVVNEDVLRVRVNEVIVRCSEVVEGTYVLSWEDECVEFKDWKKREAVARR
jgi:hypothetical protein